jgi:hypothetical protein
MEQEKAESARQQDEDKEPDELWQGFNRGHQ